MDNNPAENTKNTPSAAANSHRERGNLSAFSFFPEGDSAFFSSSLSNAQLPASTTTLRGAAMTINQLRNRSRYNPTTIRKQLFLQRWKLRDSNSRPWLLIQNRNWDLCMDHCCCYCCRHSWIEKALKMRSIKSAPKSRRNTWQSREKFTRMGIREYVEGLEKCEIFSNFELKNEDWNWWGELIWIG